MATKRKKVRHDQIKSACHKVLRTKSFKTIRNEVGVVKSELVFA